MTVVIEGSREELAGFSEIGAPVRVVKLSGSGGLELLRIIIQDLNLLDIQMWAVQGLVYSEILKRVATNLGTTVEQAAKIYDQIVRVTRERPGAGGQPPVTVLQDDEIVPPDRLEEIRRAKSDKAS